VGPNKETGAWLGCGIWFDSKSAAEVTVVIGAKTHCRAETFHIPSIASWTSPLTLSATLSGVVIDLLVHLFHVHRLLLNSNVNRHIQQGCG
jgi:hypothetical protein